MPDLLLTAARRRERWIESAILQPKDLTYPQFLAMEGCYLAGGVGSMSYLSDYCECSRGNLTGVIDRLEHQGLAYRKDSPKDRRVVDVFLTERGITVVESVLAEIYSHPKLHLPPEVRAALVTYLDPEPERGAR